MRILLKSVSVKSIEGPRGLAASVEKAPVMRRSLPVDWLIAERVRGYPGREVLLGDILIKRCIKIGER